MSADNLGPIRPGTGGGQNSNGEVYSQTEKTKLSGIETGATVNDSDVNLKNRVNHTGEQAITTVTGLQAALAEIQTTEELQDLVAAMLQSGTHTNLSVSYDDAAGTISLTAAGGGGSTLTDEEVQDIVGGLTTQGNGINVNYDDANNTLVLSLSGESFTTALKNKLDAIDMATKQDTLVSGTNIKTINGTSVLGSGDIAISGGSGGSVAPLRRVSTSRNISPLINTAVILGNNLFFATFGQMQKHSRFSVGADFVPNNDAYTQAKWYTITGAGQFTKINDSDDVLYFTTSTASQLRTINVNTKSLTTLSVSGGTFTGYGGIVSDGTDLIILQTGSTVAKRFSISGSTATYVEDITLPVAPSPTNTAGATMLGGNMYYFASGSGSGTTLIKYNVSANTYTERNDQAMLISITSSFGSQRALFNDGNYVYLVNGMHDSEDYTGSELTIIDKL